jgi:peptidyl-prolyl cis-trans isomerase D
MLQSMRNLAQAWPVKLIMGLLMVSFCLWGIGDIFRGNPLGKTVTQVGKTEITVQDLNHAFDENLAQARQKLDPSMTAAQAREMGLLDKTLDTEVKRALVDQDVARLGLDVTPAAVLQIVSQQPQFRTKDGQFNKELFRALLENQRIGETQFLAQGKQEMERQIWLAALSGSRIVPQETIDALYLGRAQKRTLEVVLVDAPKIGGIPAPSDKELHDFYDKNDDLFMAPEYRGVTVALLNTENLAKDIQISDDQVKKEYDSKLDQLAQPEKRDILQVVTQDQAKAEALMKAARTSNDLATAAKSAGENAIPMNEVEEQSLMPELSKQIFALKEGQVSEPVKTQLGWHVLQLKKITAAGTPSFDAIKEKLRADMRRDQAVESSTRIVNQIDDQLAAGHALEDIADTQRLRLVKVPALDVTSKTPEGKLPAELLNKNEVARDAFAQNSGEVSPIEDDKAGTYFIVRTDEITQAGPKPFDAVKQQVADQWKLEAQMAKAKIEADKITKAMQDGKQASEFAHDDGVTVRMSNPLSQLGDTDPLLPASILAQAFKLKKGDVTQAEEQDKQYIVRLAAIADADPTKADPRKGMIAAEVKKNAGDELLDQYIQHLYTLFPVKTNQDLYDRMRQQD